MSSNADRRVGSGWCVIVTGPTCSGKSYLGRLIARELDLPYLSKDGLKETLFDSLRWPDDRWSAQLNDASYELLYHVLGVLLAAGTCVLLESNFRPDVASDRLRRVLTDHRYSAVQIHCDADPAILMERFCQRWEAGERHPRHGDDSIYERIKANVMEGCYGALDLDAPLIKVNTTVFEQVDYTGILCQVKGFLGVS